jgi:hypothetical protein
MCLTPYFHTGSERRSYKVKVKIFWAWHSHQFGKGFFLFYCSSLIINFHTASSRRRKRAKTKKRALAQEMAKPSPILCY